MCTELARYIVKNILDLQKIKLYIYIKLLGGLSDLISFDLNVVTEKSHEIFKPFYVFSAWHLMVGEFMIGLTKYLALFHW